MAPVRVPSIAVGVIVAALLILGACTATEAQSGSGNELCAVRDPKSDVKDSVTDSCAACVQDRNGYYHWVGKTCKVTASSLTGAATGGSEIEKKCEPDPSQKVGTCAIVYDGLPKKPDSGEDVHDILRQTFDSDASKSSLALPDVASEQTSKKNDVGLQTPTDNAPNLERPGALSEAIAQESSQLGLQSAPSAEQRLQQVADNSAFTRNSIPDSSAPPLVRSGLVGLSQAQNNVLPNPAGNDARLALGDALPQDAGLNSLPSSVAQSGTSRPSTFMDNGSHLDISAPQNEIPSFNKESLQGNSENSSNIFRPIQSVMEPIRELIKGAAETVAPVFSLVSPSRTPQGANALGNSDGAIRPVVLQAAPPLPKPTLVPDIVFPKIEGAWEKLADLSRKANQTGVPSQIAVDSSPLFNSFVDSTTTVAHIPETVLELSRPPQTVIAYTSLSARELGQDPFKFVTIESEDQLTFRVSKLSGEAVGIRIPLDRENYKLLAGSDEDMSRIEVSRRGIAVSGFIPASDYGRIEAQETISHEIPFDPAVAVLSSDHSVFIPGISEEKAFVGVSQTFESNSQAQTNDTGSIFSGILNAVRGFFTRFF